MSKLSLVINVDGEKAVTVALATLSYKSVLGVAPTTYDYIRSAREDTVNGVDLVGAGWSTADDVNTSDKSFIASLAAAAGDVILLRGATATPSLATSPRRVDDRDLADITFS